MTDNINPMNTNPAAVPSDDDTFLELINACVDYFGPMDDPSIGWCDPKASHPDIFRCEKCGAEHLDCEMIPHINGCRAVRLREAMIKADRYRELAEPGEPDQ